MATVEFIDTQTNTPKFAFGLPELRIGQESKKLQLDWNESTGDITVQLSDFGAFRAVLVFSLGGKAPIDVTVVKKSKFTVSLVAIGGRNIDFFIFHCSLPFPLLLLVSLRLNYLKHGSGLFMEAIPHLPLHFLVSQQFVHILLWEMCVLLYLQKARFGLRRQI